MVKLFVGMAGRDFKVESRPDRARIAPGETGEFGESGEFATEMGPPPHVGGYRRRLQVAARGIRRGM